MIPAVSATASELTAASAVGVLPVPGSSPPLRSELLRSVLGVTPSKRILSPDCLADSKPMVGISIAQQASIAISSSKTDLLKQKLGHVVSEEEVSKRMSASPAADTSRNSLSPSSTSLNSRNRSKSVTSKSVPSSAKKNSSNSSIMDSKYAGSAFLSSPHPDHIPMPEFDENFF